MGGMSVYDDCMAGFSSSAFIPRICFPCHAQRPLPCCQLQTSIVVIVRESDGRECGRGAELAPYVGVRIAGHGVRFILVYVREVMD